MAKTPIWRRHQRLHGPDPRRDVDEEFSFHLQQRVEQLRSSGLSEDAARTEAMKRFGDLQRARQAYIALANRRGARRSVAAFLQSLAADGRYALRTFRRSPGFAVGVVLVAGLGIAVNSAVFAALNGFFMRPLPVARPHEIVRVYTSESGNGGRYGGNSYPDYRDLQLVPALSGLAAYVPLAVNVRTGGDLIRAEGRLVSENFFDVLGVAAAAGVVFSSHVAAAGEEPPVALGHAFWRRQFAADPAIVGRPLDVNGATATVVGVLPREFVGIEPGRVDVYFPAGANRAIAPGFDYVGDRGARLVRLVGRLAPGIDAARASSDLNLRMGALAQAYPETNRGRVVTVTRGSALVDAEASPMPLASSVALVFSVTGVLLLIATVNVAGLLLARTTARQRELAVRLSLGASRLRILRQLATESLVLGLAAETLALAVLSGLPLVARSLALPETVRFGLDVRVFTFVSLVTLATAVGFGIGPALRGSARRPHDGLRESLPTTPRARARGQRAMVVVQVALSIALVSTTVLLAQSIRRQHVTSPGFDAAHVVTAEFESERGSTSRDEDRTFARLALAEARQLPGVVAAAVIVSPPLTSEGARMSIDIPGFRTAPGKALEVPFSNTGPDYCAALGLRILEGTELGGRADGAEPRRVVLVNEAMARAYWPGRSPVGSTMTLGGPGGPSVPIAAVVGDARMISLSQPPRPHFYLQSDTGMGSTILIRTRTAAAPLKPVLLRLFARGVHGFVLRRVRTLEDVMGESLAEAKAFAAVTATTSLLALILAVTALYALVSYLAAQRRRELGIRLALGATRGDVIRLVLASGIRTTAVGIAIGLAATVAIATASRALVFAVFPADVVIVFGVALAAGTAAVAACALPALRAARALPSTALRVE